MASKDQLEAIVADESLALITRWGFCVESKACD
jgi:hypothetical protein